MKEFPQDSQLVQNVRLLGSLLGDVIKLYEGEKNFLHVEFIRNLAKVDLLNEELDLLQIMEYMKKLKSPALLTIARSFLHFLNLVNQAEQVHRIRRALSIYTAHLKLRVSSLLFSSI